MLGCTWIAKMSGMFCLLFVLLNRLVLSQVLLPEIIGNSLLHLREKKAASCGLQIDLDGNSGTLQHQTDPFNGTEFYRANEDCEWTVKTLEGYIMVITADYFALEPSRNCSWDYVEIEELGEHATSSKYCGIGAFTYITHSREINIRFKSDDSFEHIGFKFNIDSIQVKDGVTCNSSIIGGESSNIFNDETIGADCFFRIEAPDDKVIELDLKSIDFGSPSCEEESISIYHGLTNQDAPIGTICKDTSHGVQPFHVSPVFLHYHSPRGNEGRKFLIKYSFVEDTFTPSPTPSTTPSPVGGNNDCSGLYKDRNNYTAPPYEDNKHCVAVFRSTDRSRPIVEITFHYFQLESSTECQFDYLKIFSGERENSLQLGGPYCGDSLEGRTFFSNGNSIRLEFKTDESFALRGFHAKISYTIFSDCACDDNLKCIKQGLEKLCLPGTMCRTNKCQNGGTCLVHDSQERCYCTDGYRGENCSEKTNSSFPLLHLETTPQNRIIKRGVPLVEECVLEGKHRNAKYSWLLDGELIQPYDRSKGFGAYEGGVLKIDSFDDEYDGRYTCLAETEDGLLEYTFEYKMVYKCNFTFEYVTQTLKGNVGENVVLECQVKNARISWVKDGREIESGPKYGKIGVYQYLSIADLHKADSGTYMCKAKDAAGCQDYRKVNLLVTSKKKHGKYCGRSVHDEARMVSSLISKGQDAFPKAVPWHVMFKVDTKGDQRAFCGGTLISSRFVLTAAHCVKEFKMKIGEEWNADNVLMLLGTTDCTGGGEAGTRRRRPKHYILHPEFNKTALYDNDIALVELNEPVSYDEFIRPICLEDAKYNDQIFLEKRTRLSPVMTRGKISGCGSRGFSGSLSQTLQVVEVPYVTLEECSNTLGQQSQEVKVTPNMFCAGFKEGHKGDACQGDSGGGLTMWDDELKRWIQTGIVSWTLKGCDLDNMFGVYTNAGVFYDWIERVSKFSEEDEPDLLPKD